MYSAWSCHSLDVRMACKRSQYGKYDCSMVWLKCITWCMAGLRLRCGLKLSGMNSTILKPVLMTACQGEPARHGDKHQTAKQAEQYRKGTLHPATDPHKPTCNRR